ncbi:MAG: tetratricopeptide repeat protein [Treponema sp.]|jgi:TolA-binding protein|nr:tetratricopeptide repeat protein [Treponema sp.]
MKKVAEFCLLCFFALAAVYAYSQAPGTATPGGEAASRLQNGINLYGEGKWREAIIELRHAGALSAAADQRSEALYWIGLTELAAGEYEAALQDMEGLEKFNPHFASIGELAYHKGRALYYLGRFEEAILLLKSYNDALGEDGKNGASRRSAALYWIGECLYSMGFLQEASEVFLLVTEKYPQSAKFEAASYRIALIRQKKIEIELLGLLKWSHEESLRTMEEYQRREHSYDQALIAYQKRIADMLKDTRLSELETANAQYQKRLGEAEERIRGLERELEAASSTEAADRREASSLQDDQRLERLKALRGSARTLQEELSTGRGAFTAPSQEN